MIYFFKKSWYNLIQEWYTLWSCGYLCFELDKSTYKWRFHIVFSRINESVEKAFKKIFVLNLKPTNRTLNFIFPEKNDIFVMKSIVPWDFRSHYNVWFTVTWSWKRPIIDVFSGCCEWSLVGDNFLLELGKYGNQLIIILVK